MKEENQAHKGKNIGYIHNNHREHMLQQPHLDVKKIQIQTNKDYISDSNQRFVNTSKHEGSQDPFDFKLDGSVMNNNNLSNTSKNLNSNLDQMPKYLLKQVTENRRTTKNAGMSKYEIVSLNSPKR